MECSICLSSTIRMDVHLKTVHKLVRGTDEFNKALADAVIYNTRSEAGDDLSRALGDYGRVTQSITILFFCLFFCLLSLVKIYV